MEFRDQSEAEARIASAVKEATKSGRFMVAVWSVEGSILRLVDRTTWQFPTGDFDESIRMLRRACDNDLSSQQVEDDPLPRADILDFPTDADFLRPTDVDFLRPED